MESLDLLHANAEQRRSEAFKTSILDGIAWGYHWAFPVAVAAAGLVYGLVSWRLIRARRISLLWLLASALLLAIGGRLAILSLIHVSAFPAIIVRYLTPLYPLVLLFVVSVWAPAFRRYAAGTRSPPRQGRYRRFARRGDNVCSNTASSAGRAATPRR